MARVSAGLRHAVALTVSGNIYCWGHAKRGQCGPSQDGMQVSHVSKPVKGKFSDSKKHNQLSFCNHLSFSGHFLPISRGRI